MRHVATGGAPRATLHRIQIKGGPRTSARRLLNQKRKEKRKGKSPIWEENGRQSGGDYGGEEGWAAGKTLEFVCYGQQPIRGQVPAQFLMRTDGPGAAGRDPGDLCAWRAIRQRGTGPLHSRGNVPLVMGRVPHRRRRGRAERWRFDLEIAWPATTAPFSRAGRGPAVREPSRFPRERHLPRGNRRAVVTRGRRPGYDPPVAVSWLVQNQGVMARWMRATPVPRTGTAPRGGGRRAPYHQGRRRQATRKTERLTREKSARNRGAPLPAPGGQFRFSSIRTPAPSPWTTHRRLGHAGEKTGLFYGGLTQVFSADQP